ncbi:uncharacterized protein Dwil_GK24379 [Drosophila willistoni]|uniref:Uncharacterized protein n=1 Tax=Drosophila willistoni TaxID=7260 RepID=B4MZH1_DROWI|nr:uncharacterized protein LOC6644031 [Drosophila willistoni]EDW77756.1 uncharacterized protein Dwil_GK24379 [Drosophila willistoni]
MSPKTFTLMLLLLIVQQLMTMSLASYIKGASSTTEMASTTPTSPLASGSESLANKVEEFPAIAPVQDSDGDNQSNLLKPPPLPEADVDPLRRRLVTYDQRQEGQYNIRADLENFMILLIPQGPQEGLSLIDLLSKSSLRNGVTSKSSKRKHPLRSSSLKSFYNRHHSPLHQPSQPALGLPEFIEGRTPYHVDISASDDEQARLQARQQVDVLPPQLIPMPQLIKPYHLEAEPELIQALPPAVPSASSSTAGSSLLEGYNQAGSHYYRNSRSLRGETYLDTNRLAIGDLSPQSQPRSISVPIYRSELGAQANALYPPVDAPAYTMNGARSWQLDEEPTPIHVQPKEFVDTDVISFDLLGDDLADSKSLLRDGLARCARGERRDSYGACRQIEGY